MKVFAITLIPLFITTISNIGYSQTINRVDIEFDRDYLMERILKDSKSSKGTQSEIFNISFNMDRPTIFYPIEPRKYVLYGTQTSRILGFNFLIADPDKSFAFVSGT